MSKSHSLVIVEKDSDSFIFKISGCIKGLILNLLVFFPSIALFSYSFLIDHTLMMFLILIITCFNVIYLISMKFTGPGYITSKASIRKGSESLNMSDDIHSKTASSKKDYEYPTDYWMEIDLKDVSILKDFKKTVLDSEISINTGTSLAEHTESPNSSPKTTEKQECQNQPQTISGLKNDKLQDGLSQVKKEKMKTKSKKKSQSQKGLCDLNDCLKANQMKYFKIKGKSGRQAIMNVCVNCLIVNFENNKHCFDCNKCVKFFDHHNKFLNICIGKKNLHLFVQFLFLNWGYFCCLLAIMIHYLLQWLVISEFILFNKNNEIQPSHSETQQSFFSNLTLPNSHTVVESPLYDHRKSVKELISNSSVFGLKRDFSLKTHADYRSFQKNVSSEFFKNSVFLDNEFDDNSNLICILSIFLIAVLSIYFFYFSYLCLLYIRLLGKNIPSCDFNSKVDSNIRFSFKVFFKKLFCTFKYNK